MSIKKIFIFSIFIGLFAYFLAPYSIQNHRRDSVTNKIIIDKQFLHGNLQLPYPIILINYLLRKFNLTEKIAPIHDKQIIIDKAIKLAGGKNQFYEPGLEYFHKGFDMLIKSFKEDPAKDFISPFGQIIIHESLVSAVVLHLQVIDLIKKNKEILNEPIEKPIIVSGPQRSMTTHLQSILGSREDVRIITFFESLGGIIEPEGLDKKYIKTFFDPRKRKTFLGELVVRYIRGLFPLMFQSAYDAPSEDIDFGSPMMGTELYVVLSVLPQYSKHWYSTDNTVVYQFHKMCFQILQWQDRQRSGLGESYIPKRWVMKTPQHIGQIKPILSVFPDSIWMINKRHPTSALKSYLPMLIYLMGLWNDKLDAELACYHVKDMTIQMLNHLVNDIDLIPKDQVMLIDFKVFLKNQLHQAKLSSDFAKLPKNQENIDLMEKYIIDHSQQASGLLDYRVETLDCFNEEEINKEYQPYIEKFLSN